jgi:hypothetical protein
MGSIPGTRMLTESGLIIVSSNGENINRFVIEPVYQPVLYPRSLHFEALVKNRGFRRSGKTPGNACFNSVDDCCYCRCVSVYADGIVV